MPKRDLSSLTHVEPLSERYGWSERILSEHLKPVELPHFSASDQRLASRFEQLGAAPVLGYPDAAHTPGIWSFTDSSLVDDEATGQVHQIQGAIHGKWRELGGLAFGRPDTDEMTTPDGFGRYNHFNNGGASIYWSPMTGAHAVWGDIRARWANMGWEASYLGYPVTDEVEFAQGGRATEFQNGGIYWWPDTGAIDLRDVVVQYTGLYCFGETGWDQGSSADEPYVIATVTTPERALPSATTQTYMDVDSGDSRPDMMELYRGRPYGVNVGLVLMESDFGDRDRYRAEVQEVVRQGYEGAKVAVNYIPAVGPLIATIADKLHLERLMPALGDLINDSLDFGDDVLGTTIMTVSARDLVLLAGRGTPLDFWGIHYRRESQLLSSNGASYKLYIDVVAA